MEEIKLLDDKDLETVAGGAGDGDAVVNRALAEIGKPYEWGACGPDSYDASGLVSYALTGTYSRAFTSVSLMSLTKVQNPQPGDVCVSGSDCGIYLGGGNMVHVKTVGKTVCIDPVSCNMTYVRL